MSLKREIETLATELDTYRLDEQPVDSYLVGRASALAASVGEMESALAASVVDVVRITTDMLQGEDSE